jgi:transcriptional regulator with XRE-family HTH domain
LKLVTQQQLADRVNISVTMLSNIERGQKVPPPQLLENIAANLEISGDELFILPDEVSKKRSSRAAGNRGGF